MTKFSEKVDTKPKQRKKVVLQVEKTEEEKQEDNNFDELIKESVKEALQKEKPKPRPVHTSQAQRQPIFNEPTIVPQNRGGMNKNRNNNKNNNKNKDKKKNGMSKKDFPSLPLGAEMPKAIVSKPKKPKKVDKMDFLAKPKEETKSHSPASYTASEDNPFAMKAKRSKKHKTQGMNPQEKKFDNGFPTLGGEAPSKPKGSILGNTDKKHELESEFGIVLNKRGKKKGGRR
uniref:Uncharacterized protein n=1 Tax=Euplotes crassus TaxID=5936 RepID=A0A7S3K7N6_EUPCR|mmetsp:Transcript_13599/g.13524  ORF Transcript_13599/g.13524 Transcript_13599/m.13524 type:complete len:230 (+) Transcript_13599:1100-1789(+)